MEQLFNDLQQQIDRHVGGTVTLIDEDCGQLQALQNGEDQYPVTFPCVLISIPETIWDTMKTGMQHGKTTLTVLLAFDCYDDTHYGSTQEQHVAERMALASKLNSCLHGHRFAGCATVLIRRTSRQFSGPGCIKVYETEYTTTLTDGIQNNES